MPRTLLISREDGEALKTYGVKKVPATMKFPFIIGVGVAFLWCFVPGAESRVYNERQYLEFLNDLDRRNVEFGDDIHEQWPFVNRVPHRNPELGLGADEQEESVNRERLAEAILAKELTNNNNKNFLDRLLHLGDGHPHMRESADRAAQIGQYRRQPLDQEIQPIRIFPEGHAEEEGPKYQDDESVYPDVVNSEKEDEELSELRPQHHAPIFTSFPRIVIENNYDHKYGNTFTTDDADAEEQEPEQEEPEQEEQMPLPKPTFSPLFFPRLVAPDLPGKFNFDDFLGSKEKDKHEVYHEDEDKLKQEEQFPQSLDFGTAVVEDPNEFAVRPSDPRFYREVLPTENAITTKPIQSLVQSHTVDTPSVISKPKMNSRSDLHQQQESLPDEELQLESFVNKDVEVVPFKPNTEEDTAGVYIIAIVAGISAAATVGLIAVGIGWYNLQKHMKNAEDTDYPSYGIVGPNKDYDKKERNEAGDRKLAQSAQMYHYQHQKQQIIAMGRNNQGHGSQSESEEEEDEEGNYTVYECPGLASIEGPLEVKNPMFDDDQLATPLQTPLKATNPQGNK